MILSAWVRALVCCQVWGGGLGGFRVEKPGEFVKGQFMLSTKVGTKQEGKVSGGQEGGAFVVCRAEELGEACNPCFPEGLETVS